MTPHRCVTALGARLMLSADTTKSRKARVIGPAVVTPPPWCGPVEGV
ncbi:MAG: hypothetical protein QOJ20_4260, partial [Mycobacterium sp.]|nr:hypothetical protein [Mycobacterium sp.]